MKDAIDILTNKIIDIQQELQDNSAWINDPEHYRREKLKIKELHQAIFLLTDKH